MSGAGCDVAASANCKDGKVLMATGYCQTDCVKGKYGFTASPGDKNPSCTKNCADVAGYDPVRCKGCN
jgi:hypothetical protein